MDISGTWHGITMQRSHLLALLIMCSSGECNMTSCLQNTVAEGQISTIKKSLKLTLSSSYTILLYCLWRAARAAL